MFFSSTLNLLLFSQFQISGSKAFLNTFYSKRKTRVSPLFSWDCELFSTAHFILLTTATRPFVLRILTAFGSTWLFNSTPGCTWEHSVALGKPSRTDLKTDLKNKEFE